MRSTRRIVMGGLGVLAVAACGSGEAPIFDRVTTGAVRAVKSYRFEPADIKVAAGAVVTWTNEDNFVHNVRLLDGSNTTKNLPIGGSASITFEAPGLVRYQCSLHPEQMTGSVLVE